MNILLRKILYVALLVSAVACQRQRSQATTVRNLDPVQFLQSSGATLSADGWWTLADPTKPRVKFEGKITYRDYNSDGIADVKTGSGQFIYFADAWVAIRNSKGIGNHCMDHNMNEYVYTDNAWHLLPKRIHKT